MESLFVIGHELEGEDVSVVVETSMFVPNGTDMTLSGGLKINYSNTFRNTGKVYVKNQNHGYIVLSSGDLGFGEFIFQGSNNIEIKINGDNATIGKIKMDMPQGMLTINGNLSVFDLLDLQRGIIDVAESSSLFIDNSSPDAISFRDTPLNKAYVKGFLSRKITAGKKYLFPVGDAKYYHPFMIDKPLNDDVLSISFDENVPEEVNSYIPNQDLMLSKSFGWRVESDMNQRNTFLTGLSLFNTSFDERIDLLDVYHFSLSESKGSVGSGKTVSSYFTGTDFNSPGLYAFSQDIQDKLVNFIYVKEGNKTSFEIPSSNEYSNINLKIYNHLGSLIYKNECYRNDLNVRDFPDGTYFYELIIDKDEKQSVIRKFLEVVHEK